MIVTPEKRKRIARAKRREEQRWASKCGPVVVRHIEPRSHDDAHRTASAKAK